MKKSNDNVGWQSNRASDVDNVSPYVVKGPKISAVMSVYNGALFLEEAIRSILNQTCQDFEFIIIDDASTDGTLKVLKGFADSRIIVLKNNENIGLTKSLNIGIKHAKGRFVARMDADDISLPHRFEKQLLFLEDNPEYALVGSSYFKIDEAGNRVSIVKVLADDSAIRRELKKQNWFGHGTVMVRRQVLVEVGGYDERFKYSQDYDLWIRISSGFKVANIEEPLYCWRSTGLGISNEKMIEQAFYAHAAVLDASKKGKFLETGMRDFPPLVSVIIPTYNRPEMLAEAIQSVLNQSYGHYEIIVVNDGGADVEELVSKFNGKVNILYIKYHDNKGLAAARNVGIKNASGKYLVYLDDDDIFYPKHIETLVGFLETNDCHVAYTDAYRAVQVWRNNRYDITKRDLPYSHDFDYDRILTENYIPVLCVMHRRECIDDVGMFDENLPRIEDWDFWIRMSRLYKFHHIKEITCEFRWREDGNSMMTGEQDDFAWAALHMFHKYSDFIKDKTKIARQHDRMVEAAIKRLSKRVELELRPSPSISPFKYFRPEYVENTISDLSRLRDKYPDQALRISDLIDLLNVMKRNAPLVRSFETGESIQDLKEDTRSALEDSPHGGNQKKVRLVAFYLPQYHPISENDRWWGRGFTEWTNVAKARPLFKGHYQPRIPADLGFYDLRLSEVREAQADMARQHGIYGFCYYHYWFGGKQLLYRPFDEVLSSGKPDFPFCLCWANERWTRAWDGRSGEILMNQDYSEEDDRMHIRWLMRAFCDERYIKVDGKPLFLVYRANQLPNSRATTQIWREEARKSGIGDLYLCKVESFPDEHSDPLEAGFDAAIEFQPDWVGIGPALTGSMYGDNSVFRYEDVVERISSTQKPKYKRFSCITPGWDNSPRKGSCAHIFIDSGPELYGKWLDAVIKNFTPYSPDEDFVFINAWNEWGEGNYLEPDTKFGRAYLEATMNNAGNKIRFPPVRNEVEKSAGALGKSFDPLGVRIKDQEPEKHSIETIPFLQTDFRKNRFMQSEQKTGLSGSIQQQRIIELERNLQDVLNSHGWKILTRYYRVRDSLLWRKKRLTGKFRKLWKR